MRIRMQARPFSLWMGKKSQQPLSLKARNRKQNTTNYLYIKPAGVSPVRQAIDQPPAADDKAAIEGARILLHVSEGKNSIHHVDLWHEFCHSADNNVITVIRSRALFERVVKERPDITSILVRSARDSEWLINNLPKITAVLYVSNTGNNIHFLRYPHLKHIFLGHGDSEKAASCGKQFRPYDEVWTAGLAHIERFRRSGVDFSGLRFKVVGRPLARPLLTGGGEDHQGFLYLPTWEGYQKEQAYTSIRLVESCLEALSRETGRTCTVKFHPFTGQKDASLKNIEQYLDVDAESDTHDRIVDIRERHTSATELMQKADFLIADISSVVSDFLVTGKAIFLYLPEGDRVRLSSSTMPMDQYCYLFSNADELLHLVRQVIINEDDYLRESRQAARNYFVDIERTDNGQFERELKQVISAGRESSSTVVESGYRTKDTRIIAHRGGTTQTPENSLAAFRAAASLAGLDGVELDVHLTADDAMVVMHDPVVDRMTNGEGAIRSFSLNDLQALTLESSSQSHAWEEVIPTLEQTLAILASTNLELHIEIKNDVLGNPYPGLPRKILALIYKLDIVDRCILTSFSPTVLENIRYLDGRIRLLASVNMRLVETLGGIDPALQRLESIEGCMIAFDKAVVDAMHIAGVIEQYPLHQYGVWVVNEADELQAALDKGHRQLTTDCPERAIETRKHHMTESFGT